MNQRRQFFLDDLVDVGESDLMVTAMLRLHHDIRPSDTEVHAAGGADSDFSIEPIGLHVGLQFFFDGFPAAVRAAGFFRIPLIHADKEMFQIRRMCGFHQITRPLRVRRGP